MARKNIFVENKEIAEGGKPYIIAEIGLNHNNDMELTKKMILAARDSGADAVKFQYYKTENLMCEDSGAYNIFKSLELSKESLSEIQMFCRENQITFFATPFCNDTADTLDEMGVSFFKIASMDVTHLSLLEHIAKKGKPIILSTGMSSFGEIEKAVNTILNTGNTQLILLHCLSKYPAPPEEMNLAMITKLRSMFPNIQVGLSDHSMENTLSIAARVLGCTVFERHFTLDRSIDGPDQSISLEPAELKELREKLDVVDAGLRETDIRGDKDIASGARRSIIAIVDIPEGTKIIHSMVGLLRPGTGLAPEFLPHVINKKSKVAIHRGQLINFEMI